MYLGTLSAQLHTIRHTPYAIHRTKMDPQNQKYLDACSVGDIETIAHMLKIESKSIKNDKFLSMCLHKVCESGNINMFNVLIPYVIITNLALQHACKGGHIAMINIVAGLCIDKHNNSFEDQIRHYNRVQCDNHYIHSLWSIGILGACEGGHLELVKLYSYMSIPSRSKDYWDNCLPHACMSGNLDMIGYIIDQGATSWNRGLSAACALDNGDNGVKEKVASLMLHHGATNISDALYISCKNGDIKFAKLMIENGATNIQEGLQGACLCGNLEIAKLMINHGADNFTEGFRASCREGHIDIVQLMMKNGVSNVDRGLIDACFGGHVQVAYLMINKGARQWNGGLIAACRGGHIDTVRLMVECGATNINECMKISVSNDKHHENLNITNFLLYKGATNYEVLKKTKDFKQYTVYCKFVNRVDPKKDEKCISLLQQYPPYVFLLGCKMAGSTSDKSGTSDKSIKKLPVELLRLLCFYI